MTLSELWSYFYFTSALHISNTDPVSNISAIIIITDIYYVLSTVLRLDLIIHLIFSITPSR